MNSIKEYFSKKLKDDLKVKGPVLQSFGKIFFEDALGAAVISDHFELFVGRENELDALSLGLSQTLQGLYRRIIVEGVSGSGKTSVLNLIEDTVPSAVPDFVPCNFGADDYADVEEIKSAICFGLINRYVKNKGNRDETANEIKALTALSKRFITKNLFESKEKRQPIKELLRAQSLCQGDEDPIECYYKKCKKQDKSKLLLLFDNAEKLLSNELLFAEISAIIEKTNAVTIFSFFPGSVSDLKQKKDELVKNCLLVKLGRFTEVQCKDLLRRRLFYGQNKLKEIEKTVNYSVDLLPFTERVVEKIALMSGYVPLKFIQSLKAAYIYARENNYLVIDERCIEIGKTVEGLNMGVLNLTPRQRQVYSFILAKGPVGTALIMKELGFNSPVAAFHILKALLQKKLIQKERKGKLIEYQVTPLGVEQNY